MQELQRARRWALGRLAAGRAALNHAVRHDFLESAPHIFLIETHERKNSRPPLGKPMEPEEMARLFDAITCPHLLMFAIIAANTLARKEAILDLKPDHFDEHRSRLNLNPPARIQTKKHRSVIPVTPTLKLWLDTRKDADRHYVSKKVTNPTKPQTRRRNRYLSDYDLKRLRSAITAGKMSGPALGAEFKISSTAVYKHMRLLGVESPRNRGKRK